MEAAEGTATSTQPRCLIRLLSRFGLAGLEDHLKGKTSTINHPCRCPFRAKSSFAVTWLERGLGGGQKPCAGSLASAPWCHKLLWRKPGCWGKVRGG